MSMPTTRDTLLATRALIESPDKFRMFTRREGEVDDGRLTLIGALNLGSQKQKAPFESARLLLWQAAGLERVEMFQAPLIEWCAVKGRTHADVIALIERALAACPH